jgi:uncharacterized repeat protein (TIGR01451 family)
MRSSYASALRAGITLLLLSACTGDDAPAGLDGSTATVILPVSAAQLPQAVGAPPLPVSAAELPQAVSAPALPINRIRATARRVPQLSLVGEVDTDVDPGAASWEVELEVDLGDLPEMTVIVIFELINVDATGNESVQYSGRTNPFVVTAGGEIRAVVAMLVRGPAANLEVTGIQITEPLGSILEGATKTLAATATTSGGTPTVFWRSLDPAASVTGNVATGVLPGSARIVATAGPVSDTAVLTVLQRPAGVAVTPDSLDVPDLGPEVALTGVMVDRRGAVIAGQAVLWRSLTPAILQDLGGGRFRTIGYGRGLAEARAAADTTLKDVAVVRVRRPSADIAVTKTGPTQASEGTVVVFTVRAANVGVFPAAGVAVTETLPAGLELVSTTPSRGTFAGGVWTVGDLAVGESATLAVSARVAAGTQGQTLTNVARLRPPEVQGDANPGNDEGRASVLIVFPPADLSITKQASPTRAAERDEVEFTIVVSNAGPTAVTDLVVVESPPDGLNIIGTSTTRGSYDAETRRWSVGALAAGASATLRVRTRVGGRAEGGMLTNFARIMSFTGATDPVPGNNAASAGVIVEATVTEPQDRTFKTAANTALVAGSQEIPDGLPHIYSATHALTATNGLTVTSTGVLSTEFGGYVFMQPDGKFVYAPPPGASGITDEVSFTTTTADSTYDSATLSFEIVGPVIWYVDNSGSICECSVNGTSYVPFPSLNMAEEASGPGDWIYVAYGDGTSSGQNSGIDLKDDQVLIGSGVALVSEALGKQIAPAGDKPTIGNGDGDAVQMANGNTVTGIAIAETYGTSISAGEVSDGEIIGVAINAPYGLGIDFSYVSGVWTIADLDLDASSEGGAVQIYGGDAEITFGIARFENRSGPSFSIESTEGGFVEVEGEPIYDRGAEGIDIEGTQGDVEFRAPVVIGQEPSSTAIEVSDASGHVYFTEVDIRTDANNGIDLDDNIGEVRIAGQVRSYGAPGLLVYCNGEIQCGDVDLVFSEFVVENFSGNEDGRAIYVERTTGRLEIDHLDVENGLYDEGIARTTVELSEAAGLTFRVIDPTSRIVNQSGDALWMYTHIPFIGEPIQEQLRQPGALGMLAVSASEVVTANVVLGEIVANGSCGNFICAGVGLVGVDGSIKITGGSITNSQYGIYAYDLHGRAQFDGLVISGSYDYDLGIYAESDDVDGELVFNSVEFDPMNGTNEGYGTHVEGYLYGGRTRLSIDNSKFGAEEYGLDFYVAGSAHLDLSVTDSNFNDQYYPIYVYQTDEGGLGYSIQRNRFDGVQGTAIELSSGDVEASGAQKGTISGNAYTGGEFDAEQGIRIEVLGTMDGITSITGENMGDGSVENGINIEVDGSAKMDANIRDNNVNAPGNDGNGIALEIEADDFYGTPATCLRLDGNTLDGSDYAVYLKHDSQGTFKYRNLGSPTGTADVEAKIRAQNPNIDGDALVYVYQGEGSSDFATATSCRTPPAL